MYNIKRLLYTVFFGMVCCLTISKADASWSGVWHYIKGKPMPNSAYLGMWTFHFNKHSRENDRYSNDLFGISYKGVLLATFLNSFDDRGFLLVMQRILGEKSSKNGWHLAYGYQLGGITGYDERMTSLAQKTPILPYAGIFATARYKHVGVQITYSVVVLLANFYITFQS